MEISATDRIRQSKEEKKRKDALMKKQWYERKNKEKSNVKTKEIKSPISKEAKRKREKRQIEKEKKEKIRQQTKIRVARFRQKVHANQDSDVQTQLGAFSSRVKKHRAVKKMIKSLPKSPGTRSAVISAYLDRKSPTVKALVKARKIPSPELNEAIELSEIVLEDVKTVIKSVKNKRSEGARTAMNIICASVSGNSSEKGRKKSKLAKKLAIPVRRISSGKRIRQRVFTSEQSAFTFTQRKTRNDKIPEADKDIAYNFWISPQNARPTGNKNDIKRVRIGPKMYASHTVYILERTQTEVYKDFKVKYPDMKMCQRSFERCKPFYVLPVRPKDRQTCCCRYHVESRSIFKTCMSFRRKIMRNNTAENHLPLYEHINDLISTTMCESENGMYSTKCLNRQCENCGVDKFKMYSEESDMSDNCQVSWTRYEYCKVKSKSNKEINKLCLIKKTTPPGEMFEYFKSLLVTFPAHQFRANWQSDQLKYLLENLPLQHCICLHDFSENFACFEKNELQSSYFQKTEVTLHVSVIYRHAVLEFDGIDSTEADPHIITEHFFVISPDQAHDNHFVFQVQKLISDYLKSISYNTTIMHEFTDGCQTQYKSRHCMGYISEVSSQLGYTKIIRNYFESSHGKGPHDAAGGVIKQQATMAILRGSTIIQSARDLFDFSERNLRHVKNGVTCKRRIFRYVETVSRNHLHKYKPVPQNRSVHQIMTTEKDCDLIIRDLSCYNCSQCAEGHFEKCNNEKVSSRTFTMRREQNTHNDVEESTDEIETDFTSLIERDTIVAVYTDDDHEDYYLLKALSPPFILKEETEDCWGVVHAAGTEVVKGYYFDKIYKGQPCFRYKLLNRLTAYVPLLSVKYILSNDVSNGYLELSENDHLDILSVLGSFIL